jgi:hypothetical protein
MTQLERAEAVIRQVAAEEICRGPGEQICKFREIPPAQWCGVCKAKEYVVTFLPEGERP